MSRLLSVLSACACGQSVVQRALNASERLIVVRLTQTQPVSAKTQPQAATSCSHNTDPSFTLFHRPTKISIDSSAICEKAEHSTIYGEVVDICFNKSLKEWLHDVQQKMREEAVDNEVVQIESVDELIYKEVKTGPHEYMSLPSLYSKLSKLRLTGTFVSFMFQKYRSMHLGDGFLLKVVIHEKLYCLSSYNPWRYCCASCVYYYYYL